MKVKDTREVIGEEKGVGKEMESTKWKSFCHFAIEVLERGGKGGGDGGITEGENDLGAQAISHWESMLDTTASIIQMTTVNE